MALDAGLNGERVYAQNLLAPSSSSFKFETKLQLSVRITYVILAFRVTLK